MSSSTAAPITKTGVQGFLLWFKREQPALYNKIAPSIPKVAPKAFSNYTARRKKLGAIYRSQFSRHKVGVGRLSDYSSYSLSPIYVTAPSVSPITVDYTSQLTAPSYASYAASPTVDYSSQLASNPITTSVGAGAAPTLSSPVASAANTGSIGTGVTSAIGSLIGAAAAVVMNNQQAAALQSAVNTNLSRAAAGLAPLNTSVNSLGVPTVTSTGSMSSGTLLLLGGAAILAVMLLGGGSKKTASA